MNNIFIITKRVINPENMLRSEHYIKDLHNSVKMFKGFKKGSSYWMNDGQKMLTISEWKSEVDFNRWLLSRERELVTDRHKELVMEEEHDKLYKIIKTSHFLL